MKSRGFTLIELLITVSIIATLSAIGLIIYSGVLKNARDARRKADLKIIQSALEEYRADQKYYPGSLDLTNILPLTNATGVFPAPAISRTYLNSVPIGPVGTSEYQYRSYKSTGSACSDGDNVGASTNRCIKYCLYAKIEFSTEKTNLCPDQPDFTLEVTSP